MTKRNFILALLIAPIVGAFGFRKRWRILSDNERVQEGDQLYVENMNSCCMRKKGPGSFDPYPHKGPGWVLWRGGNDTPTTAGDWIKTCRNQVKAFRRATF
jgi:hypothetical protein